MKADQLGPEDPKNNTVAAYIPDWELKKMTSWKNKWVQTKNVPRKARSP